MEIDVRYLAGFFDADGSFGVYRSSTKGKRRRYVTWILQASVAQLDPSVLRFLKDHYGGTLWLTDGKAKRRNIWHWNIRGKMALRLVKDIYPYLVAKKEQARLAIEWAGLRVGVGQKYGQMGIVDPGPEYSERIKVLKWGSPEGSEIRDGVDVCYLAGFFDADGCVGIYPQRSRYRKFRLSVSIAQVDPSILRFLKERYGGSLHLVDYSAKKRKRRDIWHWVCTGRVAERILVGMYPYLIVKKEQARLGVEWFGLKASPEPGKRYSETEKIDAGPAYARRLKDLKWVETDKVLH